jgi:hypothetical protein
MRCPLRYLRTLAALVLFPALALAGPTLGCLDVTQALNGTDSGTSTSANDAGTSTEAGVVGGGCGVEPKTGAQLCTATSMCPNVVIDTQLMPNCGFRIRGAVVDIACACGTAICSMGAVTTCSEATQLLTNETEQGVCLRAVEGRCLESKASSSSSSSPSRGNPACDRQCMTDCGGGAACASVCNCD